MNGENSRVFSKDLILHTNLGWREAGVMGKLNIKILTAFMSDELLRQFNCFVYSVTYLFLGEVGNMGPIEVGSKTFN